MDDSDLHFTVVCSVEKKLTIHTVRDPPRVQFLASVDLGSGRIKGL